MSELNDIVLMLEKQIEKPRGRQDGPMRPKRSTKAGYKGRGYSGDDGKMAGQWKSNEQPAPRLPGEKGDDEKDRITEFNDLDDWILSMILVSFMHANPDMSSRDAIKEGKMWAKKLFIPRSNSLWTRQTARLNRYGIRAEASKIRRELFKLI